MPAVPSRAAWLVAFVFVVLGVDQLGVSGVQKMIWHFVGSWKENQLVVFFVVKKKKTSWGVGFWKENQLVVVSLAKKTRPDIAFLQENQLVVSVMPVVVAMTRNWVAVVSVVQKTQPFFDAVKMKRQTLAEEKLLVAVERIKRQLFREKKSVLYLFFLQQAAMELEEYPFA